MIWKMPGPEHRDDPDREQQARDREHDVRQAHDHAVDGPADVAGDRRRGRSRPRGRPTTETIADQQRVAGAVDDPRELVPPERVDPEPVVERGARAAAAAEPREVLDARILRRDQRREDRDEDEGPDEREADDRGRVAAQPAPGVAPEAAAGAGRARPRRPRSRRRSREPDPRVEEAVRDVDDEVDEHEDEREEEDPALEDRVVAGLDRVDEPGADPGPGEDGLGEDGAREQQARSGGR